MATSKPTLESGADPSLSGQVLNHPNSHSVQFYKQDSSLIDSLIRYVGAALIGGDTVVVIATKEHSAALNLELKTRGLTVAKALEQGRYLAFDAAEMLTQFMVDGMPDPVRFKAVIGGIVERARHAVMDRIPPLVMYGEMVALLWAEGKHEAAIQLERLWNDLAKTHVFSLLCAYPIDNFRETGHTQPFVRICEEHSAVVPAEGDSSASGHDERMRHVAYVQQQLEVLEGQKSLRESEQRFRLLIEAVEDYAIFMLDTEGRVTTWNKGAQRIKGYGASEIIGKHFSCFYPEEDKAAGKPQLELEIARREGRVQDEGWRVRKDGSRLWANVIITALKDAEGNLLGFGKVTRDFTDRMLAQRALEESQRTVEASEKLLRHLSHHLLRTQDEERRRIGRDLHDSLGQYLSVLKMKLDSLANRAAKNGSGDADEIRECAKLTEDSVKEVRTISYLLYPPMLEEMGLKTAISWYLEGFMKRSGIKIIFEVSADFERLPQDVELALFRVLQESLTNVHRHSGSRTATVRLVLANGGAMLEVRDQGKGIGNQDLEKSDKDWMGSLGVGLRGMAERMRQLGGTLDLSSTPEGATVTAIVPIAEE